MPPVQTNFSLNKLFPFPRESKPISSIHGPCSAHKKAMKSKSKTAFTWQSFNYLKVIPILSIPMFQLFNHSQNIRWHVLCNDLYWYTDSSLYSYMSFWNEGFYNQIVMRPNRVELFLTFSVHYTFTDPGSCYSFAGFST